MTLHDDNIIAAKLCVFTSWRGIISPQQERSTTRIEKLRSLEKELLARHPGGRGLEGRRSGVGEKRDGVRKKRSIDHD